MKKKEISKERRHHVRLPIMHGILEPVIVEFATIKDGQAIPQPAILSDLSAGGMRLITFMEPPHSNELSIVLRLSGFGDMPVKGAISWVKEKGGVYMNGITFINISAENKKKINDMAEEYADCDTRMALKLPEACIETCKAHYLCNKPQKNDSYFKVKKTKK